MWNQLVKEATERNLNIVDKYKIYYYCLIICFITEQQVLVYTLSTVCNARTITNVIDLFGCKNLPKLWSELVKEDLESQKHYLREIFTYFITVNACEFTFTFA